MLAGMTHSRSKPFTTAAVLLAAVLTATLMTACGSTGTPQDGRYQTHDGGRSNFRAEAPTIPESTRAS
jgi:major membrane immunogen (membrane-anchored lipoprotein)